MNNFDSVQIKKPAKNVFNLSHDVKASYNFDKIYPFLCQPIYPGDTFNCRAEVFLRAMPLKCPVMHNVDMHLWFVFVPMRLLWNENKKRDWKVFITGGEKGDANGDNTPLPYFDYRSLFNAFPEATRHGSLLDHMGFPTIPKGEEHTVHMSQTAQHVCSLPFRAYQFVWNELFRNQNVQNEIEFSYDMGEETAANLLKLFTFRKKCWEKDYFTSCLPFAQRGEAVKLPISSDIQVSGASLPVVVDTARIVGADVSSGLYSDSQGSNVQYMKFNGTGTTSRAMQLEGSATVQGAQLSFTGLEIGTINDFRYCMRLQQWLENNARCGSRYIEQLLAHFGVVSSDARMQRPEILGGGKIPLIFSDIPQTSFGEGSDSNVLGDLGGKGTMYGKTSGFRKYFEEHGILLGLCSIIPRTSYSQGLPRVWTAFDKTDWYFPEFAHLGEQAVLKKEVYFDPEETNLIAAEGGPDDVFGYQGRFTELRYIPSSVHGEMRDTLQYWHLGRLFDHAQALNSDFVEADTRANIFALSDVAEQGYDPFVCQMHLDIKAVRPLPKYAVPTL